MRVISTSVLRAALRHGRSAGDKSDGIGNSQGMNLLKRKMNEEPRWLGASLIVFVSIFLTCAGAFFFEIWNEKRARDAVLCALNDLSPNATVSVNGETRQAAPILEALRGTHYVESHHSSPSAPIEIEIRDGAKTIKLVVAQDSERPDEYWVFQPGWNYHSNPLGEFLGRTETHVFARWSLTNETGRRTKLENQVWVNNRSQACGVTYEVNPQVKHIGISHTDPAG